MLRLDHLTLIAPSLSDGVAYVADALGIAMPEGRKHREMGTHNHLLRLGPEVYLEVIAVDPDAPPPATPRWFAMDDTEGMLRAWQAGRRLRGWVARTQNIAEVVHRHGAVLGGIFSISRAGRTAQITVPADGRLPADGMAPTVIDRGEAACPAAAMPDLGAWLVELIIEHPAPEDVARLYRTLDVADPPQIRTGPELRYIAIVDTPSGRRELT